MLRPLKRSKPSSSKSPEISSGKRQSGSGVDNGEQNDGRDLEKEDKVTRTMTAFMPHSTLKIWGNRTPTPASKVVHRKNQTIQIMDYNVAEVYAQNAAG